LRHILSITFFLFTIGFTIAQSNSFVSWSVADGLPQSQVFALCQDTEGYIWVGTQGGGIARFDGKNFEKISSNQGLPSDEITALCSDSVGQVWVGTTNGLASARVGKARAIPLASIGKITSLFAHSDVLYIGTSKGLFVLDKKTHRLKKAQLSESQCVALVGDTKGKVFLATPKTVFCLQNQAEKITLVHKIGQDIEGQFTSMTLINGHLYIGSSSGQLDRIQASDVRSIAESIKSKRDITTLAPGSAGRLLVGSRTSGIAEHRLPLDSVVIQAWDESKGLPRNDVRALFTDRQGQVWIGTSGGGLARMTSAQFQAYSTKHRLPDQRIYALCRDTNEQILVAAGRNGIWKLAPQGYFTPIVGTEMLNGMKCRTLATDLNGRIWAGTDGSGVFVFTDSLPIQKLTLASGHLASDVVQKILFPPNGAVLIATTRGVTELQRTDNIWVVKNRYEDGKHITTLQADATGRVWFGASDGRVGFLENGTSHNLNITGLPATMITSVVPSTDGNLYVSTRTQGIYLVNPNRETSFKPMPESLSPQSRTVYLLAQDAEGILWAGTESGVYAIDLRSAQKSITAFGAAQGFTGLETCQDATLCDASGRMWFGTMNGLMQELPTLSNAKQEAKPYLHFQKTSLFYKPLAETEFAEQASLLFDTVGQGLVLPYNQNHLRFDFKAFNPASTQPILYRYRLTPTDADWSPWTDDRSVQFASLSPGIYALSVQAKHPDQQPAKSVTARFTITAPWWQSLGFRLASGAISIVLVSSLVWWYIKRVKRIEREKRRHLELQNKLLALEQKALQLQMNPHFIFNALNSIQSFIATQNLEKARSEMTQFSRLMRGILQNSRKQTISLKEEMDTLRDYLLVEQNLRASSFDFEVKCAENLDPEEVMLPPMLLQPFVENAIIHGVAQLQTLGEIKVHFTLEGHDLNCTVTDNGIGREKAKLLATNKLPGHQSAALGVTRDRLQALGGSLQINDRLDNAGNVIGTEVQVQLPIEQM
jgi:ligand-binding sensor domain-containing protein/two-component sensor histidine kinase